MTPNKSKKYKGFTTSKVQEITQISARKLRWWDQQGLIKPGALPGRKRWQTRRYTLQDIVCVLVIKALRERGVSLQKIRESVKRIKVTGIENPLSNLRVACLAHTVIFKKDGKFFEPISGQMVIEQALEEIRPKLGRRRTAPAERAIEKENRDYRERIAGF